MRAQLQAELFKYQLSLPIMDELAHHIQHHNNLRGKTIGWHCHLTEMTAVAAQIMVQAGAQLCLSECNPATSSEAAVEYMRELGAEIYLNPPDSCRRVLDRKPQVISDTGFVLTGTYLQSPAFANEKFVKYACEITSSGISALRNFPGAVTLPVININDGVLKSNIENFHGVGEAAIDVLFQLTSRMWSGRHASVVGYGRVGAGVCAYLRKLGCEVRAVETDPIRRLIAHYDGFVSISLGEALSESELVVTATGVPGLLGAEHWQHARDGLFIVNVGHWSTELDLASLEAASCGVIDRSELLQEFVVKETGHRVFVATKGNPANVVMLAGSPEPTLIHLTTEVLCINYLAGLNQDSTILSAGEMLLPLEIERQASILALKALALLH